MIRLCSLLLSITITFSALSGAQATRYGVYKTDVDKNMKSQSGKSFQAKNSMQESDFNVKKNAAKVTLLGTHLPDANLLRWRFSNIDSAHTLSVERSVDGIHFICLEKIKNKIPGYTDAQPLPAAWYRLCLVTDQDETVYSTVIYLGHEDDVLTHR